MGRILKNMGGSLRERTKNQQDLTSPNGAIPDSFAGPPNSLPSRKILTEKTRSYYFFVAVIVSLMTFLLYLPSLQNKFVFWDDGLYVFLNQHIKSIGIDFFRWAFFDFYASNYHPLTWISHAIDYAIWGLNPLGHHLTNNIIHAFNSFMVVVLTTKLLEIYGDRASRDGSAAFLDRQKVLVASGGAGLFFGLHPVHVESVAWIAERKDLLCALFFLLSVRSYAKHVLLTEKLFARENSASRLINKDYVISLGFFILSLLSKPMAVSLPFVLLILDWGLFKRVESLRKLWNAFIEKIPFIVLGITSSVITIIAQKTGGAIVPIDKVQLSTRLLVSVKSLTGYLGKMIMPINLSPYYPYPRLASLFSFAYLVAVVLAVGITLICIVTARKQRLWLSLWAYYIVTLIPVIGIIQVGDQSMADRYTYLPSLGPSFAIGLGAAWFLGKVNALNKWRCVKLTYTAAAIVALAFMSYFTFKQIGIWNNCIVFWSYIIEKEPAKIPVAYSNRCGCLSEIGHFDEAIEDCNMAINVNSSYYMAYNNRGNIFLQRGMFDLAIEDFDKAIVLNPSDSVAYHNRAVAFGKIGRLEEAIANYDKSIVLNPSFSRAFYNRGLLNFRIGNKELAISDFQRACDLGLDVGCEALEDLTSMKTD